MLQLNVVRLPALAEALRVKVSEVDAPTAKVGNVGDQVTVRYVLAFDGTQAFAAMVKFSEMVPVFLT